MRDASGRRLMPASACDKFRLDGRVCFLSGATGQLGRPMAEALASAGAHVLVNGRRKQAVEDLVSQLRGNGAQASAAYFDITDGAAVRDAIEEISRIQGRLDVMVNNASSGRAGTFEEIDAADFEDSYRVNVVSVFRIVKAALPLLRAAAKFTGGASVVNIASMYGSVSPDPSIYGSSGANNPPSYGSAKAALIQFTKYAACHLAGERIRVNCISPGPFPTQQYLDNDPEFGGRLRSKIPLARTGDPYEMQGPLLFLASDASSYITGINLPVDGGWTAW
jgi:NAD(P)-dependent dehydrogenase (short-subunit alcohol dehydrogenase family)